MKLMCRYATLIAATLIIPGCLGSSVDSTDDPGIVNNGAARVPNDRQKLNMLLTLSEAEAILGEPARLADSASSGGSIHFVFQSSFNAKSADKISGKTGALYFLAEDFTDATAAQKKYTSIYSANKDHAGIKVLENIGDEAYFHSDGENFCFIMARKDGRVFTMKVNKLTSHTSLEAFNRVAAEIAEKI